MKSKDHFFFSSKKRIIMTGHLHRLNVGWDTNDGVRRLIKVLKTLIIINHS